MKTTTKGTEVQILRGHFVKVIKDGVTVARAYAQVDGNWRLSSVGRDSSTVTWSEDHVVAWVTAQAMSAALS